MFVEFMLKCLHHLFKYVEFNSSIKPHSLTLLLLPKDDMLKKILIFQKQTVPLWG